MVYSWNYGIISRAFRPNPYNFPRLRRHLITHTNFTLNIVPPAAIENRSVNVICSNSVLKRIPDILMFFCRRETMYNAFPVSWKSHFFSFRKMTCRKQREIESSHTRILPRRRITLCSINNRLQEIVTCAHLHNRQYHRKY